MPRYYRLHQVESGLKNPNMPVQQITVPSGLLAWLLLIPLRGQKPCQKQAVIPDWGRSENK